MMNIAPMITADISIQNEIFVTQYRPSPIRQVSV